MYEDCNGMNLINIQLPYLVNMYSDMLLACCKLKKSRPADFTSEYSGSTPRSIFCISFRLSTKCMCWSINKIWKKKFKKHTCITCIDINSLKMYTLNITIYICQFMLYEYNDTLLNHNKDKLTVIKILIWSIHNCKHENKLKPLTFANNVCTTVKNPDSCWGVNDCCFPHQVALV